MANDEPLRKIVEDLINVMHLQAKELEKVVVQVEQVAGHLPEEARLSLIVSELSELKRRIQGLSTSP
jgi:hypothetical protein